MMADKNRLVFKTVPKECRGIGPSGNRVFKAAEAELIELMIFYDGSVRPLCRCYASKYPGKCNALGISSQGADDSSFGECGFYEEAKNVR